MKNYYEILGVNQQATIKEIKKAYRDLAKKYHSDSHPDDTSTDELMKEINAAYEVLSDPIKRANYDYNLKNNLNFNETDEVREARRNETWKATIDILKEALENAMMGEKLKNLVSSRNSHLEICELIKKFINSILFRFIFYIIPFFILGFIFNPPSNPRLIWRIFDFILLIIYIFISVVDPYKICSRLISYFNINEKLSKMINDDTETVQKAKEKYNENKEKYNDLKRILPERYAKISVAKRMLEYLESGKAKTIEEAAYWYDYEVSENIKRNEQRNKAAAKIGIASFLGIMITFLKLAAYAVNQQGKRNKNDDWW